VETSRPSKCKKEKSPSRLGRPYFELSRWFTSEKSATRIHHAALIPQSDPLPEHRAWQSEKDPSLLRLGEKVIIQ